jgi:hypothetical protein
MHYLGTCYGTLFGPEDCDVMDLEEDDVHQAREMKLFWGI